MATEVETARVFVFEKTSREVDDAKRFGEILYLFKQGIGKQRASIWDVDRLTAQILEQLDRMQFNPEKDYICICGNVVPIAIYLSTVVAEYGAINALLFHTSERCYYERRLGREFDDAD